MVTFDEELRAHHARLDVASRVRAGERVLDVGCGAGQTTREADNAWAVEIADAVGDMPAQEGGAFSLGDIAATERLLVRAGFRDIELEDVPEPVFYGDDVDDALAWATSFSNVRDALAALDPVAGDAARERLREMLATHHTPERGVLLDSRAWLITARR